MTDPLALPKRADFRGVWVFELAVPTGELERWSPPNAPEDAQEDWPMMAALGVDWLDAKFVEVFDASDLEPVGLIEYLAGANGMDRDAVMTDAQRLQALTGPVVLVHAKALPPTAAGAAFDPKPPLRFVGRYENPYELTPRAALPDQRQGLIQPQTQVPPMRFPWRIFTFFALILAALVILLWSLS